MSEFAGGQTMLSVDPAGRGVRVDLRDSLGQPYAWVVYTPQAARDVAAALIAKAEEVAPYPGGVCRACNGQGL